MVGSVDPTRFFKMADQIRTSEIATNPDFTYKDDFDIPKSEVTSVNVGNNMNSFGREAHGTPMTVPERIVLDGARGFGNEEKSTLVRDLQNNGVNFENYMGGMVTPPRTLTVDDTTSHYPGAVSGNGAVESLRRTMQKDDRLLRESTENNDDATDFRIQTEIVRLNQRVTWLEKKVEEKQSNGWWKTTLVCLLTVINPILIHWLFNRRR